MCCISSLFAMKNLSSSDSRMSSMDEARAALIRSSLDRKQYAMFAGMAAGMHLKIAGALLPLMLNKESGYVLSPEKMAEEDVTA
jgi:hypothetical protein